MGWARMSRWRLFGSEGQRAPALSHLLKVFLIDAHGEVREIYTSSFLLPDVLLNDIKTLLMEEHRLAQ